MMAYVIYVYIYIMYITLLRFFRPLTLLYHRYSYQLFAASANVPGDVIIQLVVAVSPLSEARVRESTVAANNNCFLFRPNGNCSYDDNRVVAVLPSISNTTDGFHCT